MAVMAVFSVVGLQAWGKERPVLDLQVLEELAVYADANLKSAVISRLNRGDMVVISPKIYGRFRKVLITYKGKPTGGYVLITQIKRSQIREREVEEENGRKPYKSDYAVGVAVVGSYLRQGESSFQLSDNTAYQTSVFMSTSFFMSIFADMPLNLRWSLRPYLTLRTTKFKGTAIQQNAAPGTTRKNVSREQSLTGVGLLAKRYSEGGGWWWGGGAELAMGNKVTVKVDGIEVPTSDEDKPFFLMGSVAAGGDIPIPGFKKLYLVPDVRLGLIGTTTPMTLFFESFIGVGYLW